MKLSTDNIPGGEISPAQTILINGCSPVASERQRAELNALLIVRAANCMLGRGEALLARARRALTQMFKYFSEGAQPSEYGQEKAH